MGMNRAESIIVSAWWPVPNRRQELAAAVPIDTLALNELLEELERTFPEYEIVRAGHAMAGMHGPPEEIIRWFIEVQVPWDDLAGPAARAAIEILREVITGFLARRNKVDQEAEEKIGHAPLRETPPLVPDEDVIRRIRIFGPRGQVLSTVVDESGEEP
jgi:hypothetical protein